MHVKRTHVAYHRLSPLHSPRLAERSFTQLLEADEQKDKENVSDVVNGTHAASSEYGQHQAHAV